MIKATTLSAALFLVAAPLLARAREPAELNCTPYLDPLAGVDVELCQGAWLDDKDGLPIINMRDGKEYRWIVGQVTNNDEKKGVCKLSFDIAGTEKSHGFLMDPTSLPVGKKQGELAPGELMTFSFLIPADDNGAVTVKLAKGLTSCKVAKKPMEEEEEERIDTTPTEVPQGESDYEEGGTDKDLPDPNAEDGVEERQGGVLDTTPAVNTKSLILVAAEGDKKVKTSGKVPGMRKRRDDDEDEEDEDEEDADEEAEEDEDAEAEEEEEEEEIAAPVTKKPPTNIKKPAAAVAPATEEAADAATEKAPAAAAAEAPAAPAVRALRGVR